MVAGNNLEGKKDVPGEATYADYYGKYKFEAGSPVDEVTVLWKNGAFTISSAEAEGVIDQLGTDSFHMSYMDGTILFKRDEDKKVNEIIIMVSGITLEGKKEGAAGTAYRRHAIGTNKKAVAAS